MEKRVAAVSRYQMEPCTTYVTASRSQGRRVCAVICVHGNRVPPAPLGSSAVDTIAFDPVPPALARRGPNHGGGVVLSVLR